MSRKNKIFIQTHAKKNVFLSNFFSLNALGFFGWVFFGITNVFEGRFSIIFNNLQPLKNQLKFPVCHDVFKINCAIQLQEFF